jgi:hypothetical protein
MDTAEIKLLKACLGDANGNTGLGDTSATDSGNNAIPSQSDEVYDWDHGSIKHPHLIKLVQQRDRDVYTRICNSTSTYNAAMNSVDWCDNYSPAGFYLPLVFDENIGFMLFGLTGATATEIAPSTQYHVFTTTGTLVMVGEDSAFTTDNLFSRNVYYEKISGSGQKPKDCETIDTADKVDSISGLNQCLDKLTESCSSTWEAALRSMMLTMENGTRLRTPSTTISTLLTRSLLAETPNTVPELRLFWIWVSTLLTLPMLLPTSSILLLAPLGLRNALTADFVILTLVFASASLATLVTTVPFRTLWLSK